MVRMEVSLGSRSYPILIGSGVLDELPAVLAPLGPKRVAVVTDTNVAPLYLDRVAALLQPSGIEPVTCVLPAGEENKRLEQIEFLCGRFLEGNLDRSSVVVAVGGGVTGDITGFAAACFMRGIPHVQIPTTIVAQVDSSVGGKTAVNHALGKNIIGAFHQPSGVLADLALLETLPEREYKAGLAEVIKHGVIADASLFSYLEENAAAILSRDSRALELPIIRSCEVKSAVVSEDEREQGLRAILNYGHTFGHGVEAATQYRRFLHGEAVALGMQAAAHLAQALGMVDDAFVARQRRCIETFGLPAAWPDLPVAETIAAMRHDKKSRAGTMKFILPDRMGHVAQRTDISETQAAAALDAIRTP